MTPVRSAIADEPTMDSQRWAVLPSSSIMLPTVPSMICKIGKRMRITTVPAPIFFTRVFTESIATFAPSATVTSSVLIAGESSKEIASVGTILAAINPIVAVTAAIGSPIASIIPTSAPVIPAAATGPGCGGSATCTVRSAPATGSPIFSGLMLATRAKPKMIGAKIMKPTSKKIGIPTTNAAAVTAAITCFSPSALVKECASASAPPATSITRPSIAPRPTTIMTDPRVLPMPSCMTGTTFSIGIPVASAVPTATRSNETNADILTLMTKKSRTTIAPIAIPSNVPVPIIQPFRCA